MTATGDTAWRGRAEDDVLLTGAAAFTGDIRLPDMVEAVLVRSPHAHADIVEIDGSAALAAGALAVLTANDLPFTDRTLITRYWHPAIRGGRPPLLAADRARYVGEPVALVIGRDRYEAEDLAELVSVDYRERPVVADIDGAVAADATQIRQDWPGNIAAELENIAGDADATLADCPFRLRSRFTFERQTPMPLETRGCVADHDRDGALTVWSSTQVHFDVRNNIAEILDIPEDRIRVIAEHVGGGFGSKSRPYAEEVLVGHASRLLGRPVRWIEDRLENLQATTHSRGAVTALEVGYDETGRILALKGTLDVDTGAYVFTSGIVTAMVASGQCAGPYRIPNVDMKVRCVGTNRTPLATYRGAGQPEATFPIERLMDLVAAERGMSPGEVRRRNLVRPQDMPYRASIPYAGPDARFDSGNYPAMLERLAAAADIDAPVVTLVSSEKAAWGIACGIEATGYIPGEAARVRLEPNGSVTLWSGMTSQGQSQRTTYGRVCADALGMDRQAVSVRLGDTDHTSMGRGAFASRGAVIGANAVAGASEKLRQRLIAIAARLLRRPSGDLYCDAGRVEAGGPESASEGGPEDTSVSFANIAQAVAPGGAFAEPDGFLEESFVFEAPDTLTFAFSAHAAKVAVDLHTGRVRLLDYVVTHDSGRPLDPVIVDGQVVGGIVDGVGCALFSTLPFDDQGQPLAGTLADYLVIGAPEAPSVTVLHNNVPATTNPLGVRGVGEGGVLPAPPAIANAVSRIVESVRPGSGACLTTVPITPERVSGALRGDDAG